MAPVSGLEVDIEEKRYRAVGQAAARVALQKIRLSVPRGQFVCILGPSGCGKTTLLNIIAGLDTEFSGKVSLPAGHGHPEPVVGYVFQNPRLLPWRTVMQNIELVLSPEQAGGQNVGELMRIAGLEEFGNSYPQRLSLGQSRRVALVRAFAVEPDVLLMDEPFVSLDSPTAQRLRLLLLRVWVKRPTTVVFVTHDLAEAIQLADRIVLLSASPGSVLADTPVGLSRDERGDARSVGRFAERFLNENPMLYGSDSQSA